MSNTDVVQNQNININTQTIQLIETLIVRIAKLEDQVAKLENKNKIKVYIPSQDYSQLNFKEQCYY